VSVTPLHPTTRSLRVHSDPRTRRGSGPESYPPGSSQGTGSTNAHVPEYVSIPQAARYLGMGVRYVEKLVSSTELPSYKFGRARRILRSDLVCWASDRKVSR
jgi:excisionase family DNA binding protein